MMILLITLLLIPQEEIYKVAKEYVLNNVQEECVIEPLRIGEVSSNYEDYILKVLPPSKPKFLGTLCLYEGVYVNGLLMEKIPVRLRVRVFQRIPVANRMITRHEVINEESFTYEKREILPHKSEIAVNPLGKRARKVIMAGKPILEEDVENVPIIKQGDIVNITMKMGNVRIETKGKALRDGFIGDDILVKLRGFRKEIVAKVIAEGKVEIL